MCQGLCVDGLDGGGVIGCDERSIKRWIEAPLQYTLVEHHWQ
jgi:hypothetical protein